MEQKCDTKGQDVFQLWRTPSIHQTTLVVILFAGIFAITSAFVVIFNETSDFERVITDAKNEYLKNKKDEVLKETVTLHKLISHHFQQSTGTENFAKQMEAMVKAVFEDPLQHRYVFIYSMELEPVYDPVLSKNGAQKLSQIMTIEGTHLLKALQEKASTGGGFYTFDAHSAMQKTSIPSLIFVRIDRDLGWMIGSGVYMDDFKAIIHDKEEESHNKITSFILKIVTLTLFLYLAGILKYRYLTERISKELKFIDESFKEASKTYQPVDESKIKFVEFKEITAHANRMIDKIKEKNNALLNLNSNLERIVEEKTSALQESVEYTEELLQYQDQFVKNAIHEINTPLSIILMNIELYNLKHERNAYLTKIEAAVKVLENIYDDLGYVVKKNRVEYLPKRIDFSQFLKNRVEYFSDVAEGNDVSFTCNIEEGIEIDFNEIELQRVIDNNLSNAIKYSAVKKSIDVTLRQEHMTSRVQLRIGNYGETIKEPEKLFERFYREDQARGGFGLGLNIVKEICEQNGVLIHVRSQNSYTEFDYSFLQGQSKKT